MLTLYLKNTCYFSRKVLDFAERNGIALEQKDIWAAPENLEELLARGGKKQVPYLFDEEKNMGMYESRDIIDYLHENYGS